MVDASSPIRSPHPHGKRIEMPFTLKSKIGIDTLDTFRSCHMLRIIFCTTSIETDLFGERRGAEQSDSNRKSVIPRLHRQRNPQSDTCSSCRLIKGNLKLQKRKIMKYTSTSTDALLLSSTVAARLQKPAASVRFLRMREKECWRIIFSRDEGPEWPQLRLTQLHPVLRISSGSEPSYEGRCIG